MKKEKINIADVLRDKEEGIGLYSPLCGYVSVTKINDRGFIYCKPLKEEGDINYVFAPDGRFSRVCVSETAPKYGERMLFPSYIYRNWNVFQFEKGDFVSLDFHYRDGNVLTYVVLFHCVGVKMRVNTFAAYNVNGKEFFTDWYCTFDPCAFEERELVVRPSSDEEKRILLDEIQKAGYEWHADRKDLVKKPQTTVRLEAEQMMSPSFAFKPFDKVLVRDSEFDNWEPTFFSSCKYDEEDCCNLYDTVSGTYNYCIPYNEKTAHLVGTANPYKDNE